MGQSSASSLSGPRRVISRAITHSDANTTVAAVEVPAGAFVPPYGVTLYIPEVWAGGSPSLDVGDGTTTNGWIPTAEVTETTTGCTTSTNGTYAAQGKLYTSADTIDVVVATGATTGTAFILVEYWDLSNKDVTAS